MNKPADRYGNELSTDEPTAQAYRVAADGLLEASGNLIEKAVAVVAMDPEFALAHALHARCLTSYGRGSEALTAINIAKTKAQHASAREQSHVAALLLLTEGKSVEALESIKQHLRQYPRDAVALQPATTIFGLIGLSGRLDREAELAALLDELAPHYGDDWWFMGMHAFAECEVGRIDAAADRVQKSLATNPRNFNAAHVQAHVFYEQQNDEAGAAFLRYWLEAFPDDALLRTHLAWHLSLLELSLGNAEAAWQHYARDFSVARQPAPPLNVLTDVASWLWRAELAGAAPQDEQWRNLAAWLEANFGKAGVPFGDIHRALVHVRAHNAPALASLQESLVAASSRPVFAVSAQVTEAFVAYGECNWERCAELLESAHTPAVMIGGSHAQRDLVASTYVSALTRMGHTNRALAWLASRPNIRPLPNGLG